MYSKRQLYKTILIITSFFKKVFYLLKTFATSPLGLFLIKLGLGSLFLWGCVSFCMSAYVDALNTAAALEIETAATIRAAADIKAIETAKTLAEIASQSQLDVSNLKVPQPEKTRFSTILAVICSAGVATKFLPFLLSSLGYSFIIPAKVLVSAKVLTGLTFLLSKGLSFDPSTIFFIDSSLSHILSESLSNKTILNNIRAGNMGLNKEIMGHIQNLEENVTNVQESITSLEEDVQIVDSNIIEVDTNSLRTKELAEQNSKRLNDIDVPVLYRHITRMGELVQQNSERLDEIEAARERVNSSDSASSR